MCSLAWKPCAGAVRRLSALLIGSLEISPMSFLHDGHTPCEVATTLMSQWGHVIIFTGINPPKNVRLLIQRIMMFFKLEMANVNFQRRGFRPLQNFG